MVKAEWTPVSECDAGRIAEATGTGRYHVRVIATGVSVNGVLYSEGELQRLAESSASYPVYARSDTDHRAHRGADVRQLVGEVRNISYLAEAAAAGRGAGLYGTLEFVETDSWPNSFVSEAIAKGMTNLFGFDHRYHPCQTVAQHRRQDHFEVVGLPSKRST